MDCWLWKGSCWLERGLLVGEGSCWLKRGILVGEGDLLVRERGGCWFGKGLQIGGDGSRLVKGTIGRKVGNFRQKNNSAEDGIDGTNSYFRRNSGCSAE
jgi:hypothetical protein